MRGLGKKSWKIMYSSTWFFFIFGNLWKMQKSAKMKIYHRILYMVIFQKIYGMNLFYEYILLKQLVLYMASIFFMNIFIQTASFIYGIKYFLRIFFIKTASFIYGINLFYECFLFKQLVLYIVSIFFMNIFYSNSLFYIWYLYFLRIFFIQTACFIYGIYHF